MTSPARNVRLDIPALARALRTVAVLVLLAAVCATAAATPAVETVRFGILPLGGPAESRQDWQPLVDDMAQALGREVTSFSTTSYEGIRRAIAAGSVDVAMLSGQLALDAVLEQDMQVIAQMVRIDGTPGYHAVLVVADDGPITDVETLLAQPGRWRFAQGEAHSVSGFLAPEAMLFQRRGVDSALHFASISVGNHQNNALSVANGDTDVATNNTADLERFGRVFPDAHGRLREIWRSPAIPHAMMLVSRRLSAQTRADIRRFVLAYGRGSDAEAVRERAVLARIHGLAGFANADNRALLPFADMAYSLDRRRALNAHWVSEQARTERLTRVEAIQQERRATLLEPAR